MMEFLRHLFSFLCGQSPAHTLSIGNTPMPLCERCLGFYLGAFLAVALYLWLKPRSIKTFLWFHAVLLLQIAVFLWPAIPQPPAVRIFSGMAYAFGAVGFLWCGFAGRKATVPLIAFQAPNPVSNNERDHAKWNEAPPDEQFVHLHPNMPPTRLGRFPQANHRQEPFPIA
jgi:hypothetical protein